jgi:hypothetical protein
MPFSMSYGLVNLPLPPNTALTLLAEVSATTRAKLECKVRECFALFVRLVMGAVVDYFKPVEGASWCEMLTSPNKHQWSPSGVGGWEVPAYHFEDHANGGSVGFWPSTSVVGDKRIYLPFWGSNVHVAGCCT